MTQLKPIRGLRINLICFLTITLLANIYVVESKSLNNIRKNSEDNESANLIVDSNQILYTEEDIKTLIESLINRQSVNVTKVIVDCENNNFTNINLGYLGDNSIELQCAEGKIINKARHACIQQKAAVTLKPSSWLNVNLMPHMAAIGYKSDKSKSGKPYKFDCGGSLISDKFILTAASCMKKNTPVMVRLGVNTLYEDAAFETRVDVRIKNQYIHPLFNSKWKYYDIGILELETPVNFSLAVYPVCLDTSEDDLKPDMDVYIAGWGATEYVSQANVLQYAQITTLSNADCAKRYEEFDLKKSKIPKGLRDTQFCAGHFTQPRRDACDGDTGGPVQSEPMYFRGGKLYGIISFEPSCGGDAPTIYTKVSPYREWIESIVWPDIWVWKNNNN